MKICFIADGRSPIAENWIRYFTPRGHDVSVISTYPCSDESYPNVSLSEVTSMLSRKAETSRNGHAPGFLSRWVACAREGTLAQLTMALQHRFEQFEVPRRANVIRLLLRQIQPDVIHAMRLPFEGIMAAQAEPLVPLLVSIWGNDLTLFAAKFRWTRRESYRALARIDALHCDCERDLKLAGQSGFDLRKPAIVLPGNGGIQLSIFGGRHRREGLAIRRRFDIPDDAPLVCNPRGFRSYVRNDTFFRSAARTARKRPDIVFASVGMRGHSVAERWISSLRVEKNVRLLPSLPQCDMAELLRTSDVMVSPSEHDGTPNTLLESMAAGAFPVVGDIESVREWITDGVNGNLRSPADPGQFSETILSAINNSALRQSAAVINRRLITERAEYTSCMNKAEEFYHQLIGKPHVREASGF